MRRLTTCFAALALVLAACGDDDDTAASSSTTQDPVSTTPPETSPSSTSSTSSTSTTTVASSTTLAEDDLQLAQACDSPDGFTISYPQDWGAVSDCGQFGPEPIDEPAPSTDERTGAVSAFIDPVPFEQVAEPAEGDRDRREATIDGRDAIRVEGQVTGEGLYPQGTEYVRWLVDVTDGGAPATLFVDAYDLGDGIEFDQAVGVLDAMAGSLQISDR